MAQLPSGDGEGGGLVRLNMASGQASDWESLTGSEREEFLDRADQATDLLTELVRKRPTSWGRMLAEFGKQVHWEQGREALARRIASNQLPPLILSGLFLEDVEVAARGGLNISAQKVGKNAARDAMFNPEAISELYRIAEAVQAGQITDEVAGSQIFRSLSANLPAYIDKASRFSALIVHSSIEQIIEQQQRDAEKLTMREIENTADSVVSGEIATANVLVSLDMRNDLASSAGKHRFFNFRTEEEFNERQKQIDEGLMFQTRNSNLVNGREQFEMSFQLNPETVSYAGKNGRKWTQKVFRDKMGRFATKSGAPDIDHELLDLVMNQKRMALFAQAVKKELVEKYDRMFPGGHSTKGFAAGESTGTLRRAVSESTVSVQKLGGTQYNAQVRIADLPREGREKDDSNSKGGQPTTNLTARYAFFGRPAFRYQEMRFSKSGLEEHKFMQFLSPKYQDAEIPILSFQVWEGDNIFNLSLFSMEKIIKDYFEMVRRLLSKSRKGQAVSKAPKANATQLQELLEASDDLSPEEKAAYMKRIAEASE